MYISAQTGGPLDPGWGLHTRAAHRAQAWKSVRSWEKQAGVVLGAWGASFVLEGGGGK